jgi:L-fuconolactonase
MSTEHRHWLARAEEDALEPDLDICDPHVHLWDRRGDRYLLDDLHADTGAGHRVREVVYVECRAGYRTQGPEEYRPVGETEAASAAAQVSEARQGATIAGIVGHADLRLGAAIEPVLLAHAEAGGGRFCGIRQATTWDANEEVTRGHRIAPPGLMLEPAFRDGLRTLARLDLRFDAWLYHPQIPELTQVAQAVPELTVILDHLGGPLGRGPYSDRAAVREQWRRDVDELARCDNVVVKLGGIGMPIFGLGWERRHVPPTSEELAAAWEPEITFCIERFGAERCMFESNYPVDGRSASYGVLWNAFKRICTGASPDEKRWLFRETAVTTYGLPAS